MPRERPSVAVMEMQRTKPFPFVRQHFQDGIRPVDDQFFVDRRHIAFKFHVYDRADDLTDPTGIYHDCALPSD